MRGLRFGSIGVIRPRRIARRYDRRWGLTDCVRSTPMACRILRRLRPRGTRWMAMIERPGNMDIQLDLFLDYANNVKLTRRSRSTSVSRSLRCWQSGGGSTRSLFLRAQRLSRGIIRMRRCSFWIRGTLRLRRTSRRLLRRCGSCWQRPRDERSGGIS
jgi:hypothetical protein